MNGYVLVCKKAGMTSHDVVNIARKKFKTKQIGHTGTLDPFATGLLILLINDATKLAYLFDKLDKEYQGIILFGAESDTLDSTGSIAKVVGPDLKETDVDLIMSTFIGKYLQYPPLYSAKKVGGRKLYQYARNMQPVTVKPSEVWIKDFIRTSSIIQNEMVFKTTVSSGTYIRSLAADLGTKLQTKALLKSLVRTKIGPYDLQHAANIDDLDESMIISDLQLFDNIKQNVVLDDYEVKLALNGVLLDERQIKTETPFLAYDKKGRLIGYFEVIDHYKYKLKYSFRGINESNHGSLQSNKIK